MAFTEDVKIPIVATDLASKEFEKVRKSGEKMVASFQKIADTGPFKKAASAVKLFGNAIKAVHAQSVQINQSLEIARKVVAQVQKAFSATAGEFVKFEKALVGVGKTTSLSGDELSDFGDMIQQMSIRIPVAANELLDIAGVAGQLGIDGASNLELFTETIAKVGVATNLTAEEAAVGFARMLAVSGQSVTEIDRLASSVVALGNTFETNEQFIVRMANEVGRATNQFGVNAQTAAALGAAMNSLGIQAQLGGSAMGKAFRTIDLAVRSGGAQLERLSEIVGVSGEQIKTVYEEDSVKAFQMFIEGLQRIDKENKSVTLALETLGLKGDEINKVLPVMALRAEKVGQALALSNKAFEDNVALNEEAAKAFATLGSTMSKFTNAVVNLGTDIGAFLAPAISFIFETLTSGIETIRSMVDNTKQLTAAFKLLTTAVIALGAAFVFANFGLVLTHLSTMIPLVWGAVKAFAAFALQATIVGLKVAAVGVALAAVGATIELVVRNFGKLKEVGIVVMNSITSAINLARMQLLELARAAAIVLDLAGAEETGASLLASVESEQLAISENIQKSLDDIEDAGSKLELGFAPSAVKDMFNSLFEAKAQIQDIGVEGEKSGNKTGIAFQKAAKDVEKLGKEFEKAVTAAGNKAEGILEKISDRTKEINTEVAKAGADTRGKIEIEAAGELQLIADFDQAKAEFDRIIAAQGKAGVSMTKAQEEQAKAFAESGKVVDEFRQAVEAQKGVALGEKGLGEGDPLAGGLLEAGAAAAGGMASAVSAALDPISQIMAAAQAVVGIVQQMIDFIPQMLDAITNIFTSLTELPTKIAEGMANLFSGIAGFIKDFIPNLINAIEDIIVSAIEFLAEGLPDAVLSLAEKVPELLTKFAERIPELVEKLALGLARSGPLLATQFTLTLLKNWPQVTKAFIEAMGPAAVALVDGFVLGFKEAFNNISNLLGLGDIFNIDLSDATEQLEELGDNISRSASNLFEVIDLEAAARGLDVADRIRDAIVSGTTNAKNVFSRLWDKLVETWRWVWDNIILPIIEGIRAVWLWIWDNILEPIIEGIRAVWIWIWDNVLEPVISGIRAVFQWVMDNIFKPILDGIQSIFLWVNDNILAPFVNGIQSIFLWVNEHILAPFTSGVRAIWEWINTHILAPFTSGVRAIWEWINANIMAPFTSTLNAIFTAVGAVFNAFTSTLNSVVTFFGSLISKLEPIADIFKNFSGGGGGLISGTGTPLDQLAEGGIVAARYAEGGSVVDLNAYKKATLYAQTGTFVPKGTDTVPAMLTPGEFVVNREATRNNLSTLQQINRTNEPFSGGGPTNISVVINTKTDLSADQIRREVMPTLKKELKRESLAGKFVIARPGIRSSK